MYQDRYYLLNVPNTPVFGKSYSVYILFLNLCQTVRSMCLVVRVCKAHSASEDDTSEDIVGERQIV